MRQPEAISEILGNLLKRRGLARKMAQYEVFEIWEDVVGSTIAKQTTPQKMQGDILVVAVKSAAWAQELTFIKPLILKRIREKTPDAKIADIRFTAGRL